MSIQTIDIFFFFEKQEKGDVPKDNEESGRQIVGFGHIDGKLIA